MKISIARTKLFISTHAHLDCRYGFASSYHGRLRSIFVVLLVASLWPLSLTNANSYTVHGSDSARSISREQNVGEKLNKSYARLPLAFEQNQGQLNQRVKFLARGAEADLYLTSNEVVLSLARPKQSSASASAGTALRRKGSAKVALHHQTKQPRALSRDVLTMRLANAKSARVVGVNESPGTVNYFIGNNPKRWHTDIRTYQRVAYRGVYPGIDQIFYGQGQQLEYDFVVAPGANPRLIKLAFTGARDMVIDRHGDLVLHARGSQEVRLHKPFVYQELNGHKREITARYKLNAKRQISFELGEYDVNQPLIIDPVLTYSTYLGGSRNDAGFDVAVDANGNAYVTGSTDSNEFSPLGGINTFVAKLNPAGTERTFLAILGGSGDDVGFSLAVDNTGAAYVAGATESVDFPGVNANQLTFGGGAQDAFIAKLNPAGSAVTYATYFGGSGSDAGFGIAIDSTGNAYVTGSTNSPELSTLGNTDAFITKLSPTGSERLYLSIVGGSGDDSSFDIAVDSAGSAYVVGSTDSTNFTVANALQPNLGGSQDVFVAKLNTTGSALVYSTYLGGSGHDSGFGIAVDGGGGAYITGSTDSPEFTSLGSKDVFVTKLDATGINRTYFSILGGSGDDVGFSIAADVAGNVYVTGSTSSTNFTTTNALQQNLGGAQNVFLAKLNPAGATLVSSTFLGGSGNDAGFGIAVDSANSAYITGFTSSNNFPTSSPLQSASAGNGDVFIAKIGDAAAPAMVQFNAVGYSVREDDGRATVTITRTGDTSGTATVDYRTSDTDTFTIGCADTVNNGGGAYARCDFATTVGTLSFAAGEINKTITVPLINDGYVEGTETFQLQLSNATGTTLGTQNVATITLQDNDAAASPNPIITLGQSDYPFFVRQQYLDFLSREPEPSEPWTAVLTRCPNVHTPPSAVTDCDRIAVSAAFFGSPEFRLKGFYVFRFYKVAFNRLPQYGEVVSDMSFVAGATEAEVYARKAQLATLFAARPEFTNAYGGLTNAQLVATLLARYQLASVTTPDPATPDGATKVTLSAADLTNGLNVGTLTRAQMLRAIADSDQVAAVEYNSAFVASQYYGYLRRTPEDSGYQAWLRVINQDPNNIRIMVNGFMNSTEYRLRFGQP